MAASKDVFRPRARLLQHLGDQLIGSKRLAVFELVKNAYDADASKVTVRLSKITSENPSISIKDDGTGMSAETIRSIWLVIAHDHRKKQLDRRERTAKGRLPMGSKGLGRLSVHKLGNQIKLVTRAEGMKEVVVRIDWEKMMTHDFLEDAEISIKEREPKVFSGTATGTKITVTQLREKKWSRGEVRRLYRQITSISSPFGIDVQHDFKAELIVPEHSHWIDSLPDPKQLLERAPWKFTFEFDGRCLSYSYEFTKIPGIERQSREVVERCADLVMPAQIKEDDDPLFSGKAQTIQRRRVVADIEDLKGIGPLSGEMYVFDLTARVSSKMEQMKLIRMFLADNGGIRIYRDGIRVYDYGEPNNDWLGLDLKRVNNPTKGLSRNIMVGHIMLTQGESDDLVEKSNREGFIENEAYDRLKRLVLGILMPLQLEREVDRKAIRELTGGPKDTELKSILEPVTKIRIIASKRGLSKEINPLLDRIEHEYSSMRDRLLTTGISGTSLAVVFHEIEQGVSSLYHNLEGSTDIEGAREQVREMMKLLDGFSELLRRKDRNPINLAKLIKRARDLNRLRFRHHNVRLVAPDLDDVDKGPMANCSFGLTLGALTNIIDNAIFWMRAKWPEENDNKNRAIYIGIDENFENGPAIVIADTGPGFKDSTEELVRPFYTRRPDGMGMGLYYANMVMDLNDGELLFPDRLDTDVPKEFNGAIVALRFADMGST